MTENKYMAPNEEEVTTPLFAGLTLAGVTGRDVAKALRVSPATVSKWRRGHTNMDPDVQIFLTLMLAEQVGRLTDMYAAWGPATPAWHLNVRAGLEAARDALAEQEDRNAELPPTAIHSGARRFRVWWNAGRVAGHLPVRPSPAAMEAAAAS